MTRPRASFSGLVADEQEQSIHFAVPPAEAEAARALAHEQGWLDAADEPNWPLLFVAIGLAALRRERDLARLDRRDATAVAAERARLRRLRMRLDGQVAPLRFAAFELARTNAILEIKQNALRIDNRGMRLRLGEDAP